MGKLRREISLSFQRSYDIELCFDQGSSYGADVISGSSALEQLSAFHGSEVLDPYRSLLNHDASFAVKISGGGQGFIVIPHPNTTTLPSPSTANFITVLPLAVGDTCLQNNGQYGSNGGPITEWCKCELTACTPNCVNTCTGSSGQLDELSGFCSDLDPFKDDRPIFDLWLGNPL